MTPGEAPGPPPSGQDRCFLVLTEYQGSKSSLPETSFALKSNTGRGAQISIEWQESAKEEPTIGFLDLPKEIRDMVYIEICSDLKREGFKSKHTGPPPGNEGPQSEGRVEDDGVSDSMTVQPERPSTFSDCAIMRTCKQIHAEFAEVLYSVPLHLYNGSNGTNIIPISPTYAPAVRSVLFVNQIYFTGLERAVAQVLQMTTSLSKIFPNLAVLRAGWWKPYTSGRVDEDWDVKDWEKLIKRVKREANTPLQIPWCTELIELHGAKYSRRPWPHTWTEVENQVDGWRAEALRNMRSKPKKGTTLTQRYFW